jgi:hypothetical protein
VAVFHEDDTYDAFINGKAFVSGKYNYKNDTIGIIDHFCDTSYTGLYKVTFVNADSISFHVISDTCPGRKEGIDGYAFRRAKGRK